MKFDIKYIKHSDCAYIPNINLYNKALSTSKCQTTFGKSVRFLDGKFKTFNKSFFSDAFSISLQNSFFPL